MKRLFTLLSSVLLTCTAFAQIPNASFETWTTTGSHHDATGWSDLNAYTSVAGIYTCDSSQTGVRPGCGTSYMKLISKDLGVGVVPGIAVSGILSVTPTIPTPTYTVTGGFVNTTRPQYLQGVYQYMGMGTSGDNPRIGVFLWKWNTANHSRDTVAKLDTSLTGMEMMWKSFSMPLHYIHGDTPDSGIVVLSSSAALPVDGSYLYIDSLAFSGSVPNGVVSIPKASSSLQVYPNPATGGKTSIYYHSNSGTEVSVYLTDMAGRTVRSFNTKTVSGENDIPLDLKGVAQGLYVIKLVDETGTAEKKLLVQ